MSLNYGHNAVWKADNDWVFSESSKKHISKNTSGYINRFDNLSEFRYKGEAFLNNLGQTILIWEFKSLYNKDLRELKIGLNKDLDDIKFNEYEILDKNLDFKIFYEYKTEFNNQFVLDLSKSDSLVYEINGPNYKGYYGLFNRAVISNEKGPKILFLNNENSIYMTFLIVNKNLKNYLIVIHSDYNYSNDILNIFDFVKINKIR